MSYLWGGMILLGVIYGALTGNLQKVTEAAVNSSREAVSLCITMAGVTALWVGLMKIAENSGLVSSLTRRIRPLLRFLFPSLDADSPAGKYLALNILSNLLGLGWAATPAGLKAMEELAKLEEERRQEEGRAALPDNEKRKPRKIRAVPKGVASNEMCTFLILNISSLQLIPVNVIAYRAQYGSVNPTAIVGPGIVATAVSTGVAIVFCKMMDKRRRRA